MASLRTPLIPAALLLGAVYLAGSVACGAGDDLFQTASATGTGGPTTSGSTAQATGSGVGAGGEGAATGTSTAGGETSSTTSASQGGAGEGGTGQGGAAQGGTGGGVAEESCLDDLDDDGDGLADCEDPDCSAGFTCAPGAPPLWAGVGWLDASPSPRACPADLRAQTDLYDAAGLDADPASCSCACGPAAGVDCGTHMRCASNPLQCAASGPMNGQSTSCGTNIPNVLFPAFCRADPVGAFGGACAVSTVGAPPPVSWAPATRACTTDGGGACADAAAVCIPKLAGGVGPCITRAGDHGCPPPYTDKVLYYDGQVMDDRSCDGGSCSCSAPMGSTCDCGVNGCEVELDGDLACTMMTASVPTTGSCVAVQSKPGSARIVGATPVPGPCASGGSAQPIGGVVPTGPVTVCCMP